MKKIFSPLRKGVSLLILVVLFSCGKDDSAPPQTIDELEVEISQFQLALLKFTPGKLTEASYLGSIEGEDFELIAIGDSILVLNVGSMDPGVYDLQIQDLPSTRVQLTVLKILLDDTPTAIVTSLIEDIEGFDLTEYPEITSAISSLTEVFANASEEDQFLMAATYRANKEIFDSMFADLHADGGRVSAFCGESANFCKFSGSLLVIAAGVIMILPPTSLVAALPGILTITAGFILAIKHHDGILDSHIKTLNTTVAEIFGLESGRTSSTSRFELVADNPYILSVSATRRTLNSSDGGDDNELLAQFFSHRETLIDVIEKTNTVIELANKKVPFANFDLIETPSIPAKSTKITETISNATFKNYSFALGTGDLIATASLHSPGKIKLIVSANKGVDLKEPRETDLVITYKDDYNDKRNKFPITVVKKNTNNHFRLDNVNYSLARCFIDDNEGSNGPGVKDAVVILTSSSINFSGGEFVGIGDALILGFVINENGNLGNGIYNYSSSETTAGTFTDGYAFLNFDAQNSDDEGIRINSGKIKISGKTTNQITMELDLNAVGGKKITGIYSGTFQEVDR